MVHTTLIIVQNKDQPCTLQIQMFAVATITNTPTTRYTINAINIIITFLSKQKEHISRRKKKEPSWAQSVV